MSHSPLINRIIAADDLHYDASQKRFVSLSETEVDEIIVKCLENGIGNAAQVQQVVAWVGALRVGQMLYRAFMTGQVRVTGIRDKEPLCAPLPLNEAS
jgi:hypothetical protein